MQAVIRRKLSMAGHVLAFERAHPSTDQSHQVVVTRLAALVGRVDEVFTQDRLGAVGERGVGHCAASRASEAEAEGGPSFRAERGISSGC